MHVFKRDVAVDRKQVAVCQRVPGREDDGIPDIANANIFVDDIMHRATTAGVALDAYPVVGSIDGEVGDAHRADSAYGFAADGHSVPGVEMIVRNGNVG